MEIHPPSGPVASVKEFFLHLSMITIGILIALGLEQAVASWHHHELGIQARENILSEIRDNQRDLDGVRTTVKKNKEELQHAEAVLQQLLQHKKVESASMALNVVGAGLSSAAWDTATVTGALGYMGYDESKKFAGVYELQGILKRFQEDQFRTATRAIALVAFRPGKPEDLPAEELRTIEHNLVDCLAEVTMWEQLASQLSTGYAQVLKEK